MNRPRRLGPGVSVGRVRILSLPNLLASSTLLLLRGPHRRELSFRSTAERFHLAVPVPLLLSAKALKSMFVAIANKNGLAPGVSLLRLRQYVQDVRDDRNPSQAATEARGAGTTTPTDGGQNQGDSSDVVGAKVAGDRAGDRLGAAVAVGAGDIISGSAVAAAEAELGPEAMAMLRISVAKARFFCLRVSFSTWYHTTDSAYLRDVSQCATASPSLPIATCFSRVGLIS